MICPLCIDECEPIPGSSPFPFCASCLTTLRTFVRTEKQRPPRRPLPSCPDCKHAWANHGPTPAGEPIGCSLCDCKALRFDLIPPERGGA
jgi:hypothetical protein